MSKVNFEGKKLNSKSKVGRVEGALVCDHSPEPCRNGQRTREDVRIKVGRREPKKKNSFEFDPFVIEQTLSSVDSFRMRRRGWTLKSLSLTFHEIGSREMSEDQFCDSSFARRISKLSREQATMERDNDQRLQNILRVSCTSFLRNSARTNSQLP